MCQKQVEQNYQRSATRIYCEVEEVKKYVIPIPNCEDDKACCLQQPVHEVELYCDKVPPFSQASGFTAETSHSLILFLPKPTRKLVSAPSPPIWTLGMVFNFNL